jgi:hypothetical protein
LDIYLQFFLHTPRNAPQAVRNLKKLEKKANAITQSSELSGPEKVKQLASLYKKAKLGGAKSKPILVYVVGKRHLSLLFVSDILRLSLQLLLLSVLNSLQSREEGTDAGTRQEGPPLQGSRCAPQEYAPTH